MPRRVPDTELLVKHGQVGFAIMQVLPVKSRDLGRGLPGLNLSPNVTSLCRLEQNAVICFSRKRVTYVIDIGIIVPIT